MGTQSTWGDINISKKIILNMKLVVLLFACLIAFANAGCSDNQNNENACLEENLNCCFCSQGGGSGSCDVYSESSKDACQLNQANFICNDGVGTTECSDSINQSSEANCLAAGDNCCYCGVNGKAGSCAEKASGSREVCEAVTGQSFKCASSANVMTVSFAVVMAAALAVAF